MKEQEPPIGDTWKRSADEWLQSLTEQQLQWLSVRIPTIRAHRRVPSAQAADPGTLTGSERSQLKYLAANPGIWGGPLDRGQAHEDPNINRWVKHGWVEIMVVNEKHGFYLTDAGRAALGPLEREGRTP